MKLRAAASVFAIAAAITACSSSSSGGGPASVAGGSTGAPVTAPAGSASGGSSGDFCAKLTSANGKLGNLSAAAGGGDFGAIKTVIEQEVAAFQDLGNGAPADVKPTIDDIVTSLQAAESALADPAHPDLAKLQALGTTVPADVTKLTTYVTSNCS